MSNDSKSQRSWTDDGVTVLTYGLFACVCAFVADFFGTSALSAAIEVSATGLTMILIGLLIERMKPDEQ